MAEIGIDISGYRSKSVDEFVGRTDLDLVITVCDDAKDDCPVFTGNVERAHIAIEDPAPYTNETDEIAMPKFREIRDEIKTRLLKLLRVNW